MRWSSPTGTPRLAEGAPSWARERIGLDGAALILYGQGALVVLGFVAVVILQVIVVGGVIVLEPSVNGPDVFSVATGIIAMLLCGFPLMIAFSTPYFIAGWGIRHRKPWSHVMGLIMSGLSLSNFPIGLVGGVLCLMVLTDADCVAELKRGPVDEDRGLNE